MASQRHNEASKSQRVVSLPKGRKPTLVENTEDTIGREEEFLHAALELFAKRNFASVTIKDIAQSLDVNTGLIYYYFKNKTDLFRATIAYAVENAFANMRTLEENHSDPARLLSAWLNNHVDKYAEIHRFVKIALDFRGSHEGNLEIEATIASFYTKERELLSRSIRQGIEQGLFKPVDPVRTANFISTYLDGCMVRSVILQDFNLKVSVGDLQRQVLEMLSAPAPQKASRRR